MTRDQRLCRFVLLLGLAAAVTIGGGVLRAENPTALVQFSAMGDVPYSASEDRLLAQQITALPAGTCSFCANG